MKQYIRELVAKSIAKLYPEHKDIAFSLDYAPDNIDADFASNAAMVLAKKVGKKPMEAAEEIASVIPDSIGDPDCRPYGRSPEGRDSRFPPAWTSSKRSRAGRGNDKLNVTVAPPGFLNFKLSSKTWQEELANIIKQGEKYGSSSLGKGKKVNIEFVSANPTGPLTVGHGRGAVIGLVVSNVLKSQGYKVVREYYYNDGGLQMKRLGESVKLSAFEIKAREEGRESHTEGAKYPGNSVDLYLGAYIKAIAEQYLEKNKANIKTLEDVLEVSIDEYAKYASEIIFSGIDSIKETLSKLGVSFDNFVKESEQASERVLKDLEAAEVVYEKDGAKWLKNIKGREDKVLVRKTREPTYRLPDIAYHLEKVKKYDKAITILGADHVGQFPDISYAVEKLGGDPGKIQVIVNQFVTLDGGKKMSTRKANYVTLDELLEEVGPDVTKFFMLMSAPSAHMNFDMDLAKDTSEKNPVYKVQYAHARINSILKKATHNAPFTPSYLKRGEGELLRDPYEQGLIKELSKFPELVEETATTYSVHHLPHYLLGLAEEFHKFYEKVRVISDDEKLTEARLGLVHAVKTVLANGLKLMGITPKDKM